MCVCVCDRGADKGYLRGGSSVDLTPAPDALSSDQLCAGMRLGLLYNGTSGTVTLFVRHQRDGYAPIRFGSMDVNFGGALPYLVINLYGQTRAVRVVRP